MTDDNDVHICAALTASEARTLEAARDAALDSPLGVALKHLLEQVLDEKEDGIDVYDDEDEDDDDDDDDEDTENSK